MRLPWGNVRWKRDQRIERCNWMISHCLSHLLRHICLEILPATWRKLLKLAVNTWRLFVAICRSWFLRYRSTDTQCKHTNTLTFQLKGWSQSWILWDAICHNNKVLKEKIDGNIAVKTNARLKSSQIQWNTLGEIKSLFVQHLLNFVEFADSYLKWGSATFEQTRQSKIQGFSDLSSSPRVPYLADNS